MNILSIVGFRNLKAQSVLRILFILSTFRDRFSYDLLECHLMNRLAELPNGTSSRPPVATITLLVPPRVILRSLNTPRGVSRNFPTNLSPLHPLQQRQTSSSLHLKPSQQQHSFIMPKEYTHTGSGTNSQGLYSLPRFPLL